MLKKWISITLVLILLVGCNSAPKITKEELLEKMNNAEKELRSVQMDMELKEKNETSDNVGRYLDTNQYIYNDELKATSASYKFVDEARPENNAESYYLDGHAWTLNEEGKWTKEEKPSASHYGDYFDMLYFTTNSLWDQLTLDGMTLSAKGTDFSILDDLVGYSMVTVSDNYKASDFEYQATVDPKTFFIEKVQIRINYKDPQNEKNFINHVVTKKFSKFNEIKSIEPPAETQ